MHKTMKIHLDTDLGGDIDDLCALALLLSRSDVEITAITTVCENDGRRAGYARYVLEMAGRGDIPVAAGADGAQGFYRERPGLPEEADYWPAPIPPAPGPIDRALDLLKRSIDQGAIVTCIGPYTNLYLFEQKYPGYLARAQLVLMGGYVYPPRPGYPPWTNAMDYNVQADVRAARAVLEGAQVTLVPMAVTLETALRRAHLPALRSGGALSRLIAHQAEAWAREYQYDTTLVPVCPRLPRDFINFQHDPLACAIALGWNQGVVIVEITLALEEKDGWLVERIDEGGKPARLVTNVDGPAFDRYWFDRIVNL
jgi:purine nucleosidase